MVFLVTFYSYVAILIRNVHATLVNCPFNVKAINSFHVEIIFKNFGGEILDLKKAILPTDI